MWILTIYLALSLPHDHFRFRYVSFEYATEAQCQAAQLWWLNHQDARPEGFSADWWQFTGPSCDPPEAIS